MLPPEEPAPSDDIAAGEFRPRATGVHVFGRYASVKGTWTLMQRALHLKSFAVTCEGAVDLSPT